MQAVDAQGKFLVDFDEIMMAFDDRLSPFDLSIVVRSIVEQRKISNMNNLILCS